MIDKHYLAGRKKDYSYDVDFCLIRLICKQPFVSRICFSTYFSHVNVHMQKWMRLTTES